MKGIIRKVFIWTGVSVAAFFAAQDSAAQEFKWGLQFDTKFDNREYDAVKRKDTINSRTFFSVRLAPVIGVGWAKGHSVMGGGSFTFDIGAPLDKREPELLLYYNYDSPRFHAYAGMFERRRLVGSYSRAIYAGSHTFYDNVIEGFALQYTPRGGSLELILDWDGMQSPDVRESFRVMSAGELNPVDCRPMRWLTAGYSLDVYHLASSANAVEGVVDHILVNPWIGASFDRLGVWFDKLSLTVGWMNSFDRERRGDNKWKRPGGVTVDFEMRKWNVGIRNRLYLGDRQMPFWGVYGSRIYRGDQFYAVSGTYNYTQIYWRPKVAEGVRLDLEVGLHSDGKAIGWQQVAWIGVSLDSGMFKGRKKRDR